MPKLRNLIIMGSLVVLLVGVVFGTYRVVSRWHPTASNLPTSISQLSSVAANVDPGVTLKRAAPNFTLTNQFNQTVSLKEFRGKVVVLTFIDSKCTTVCPLTAVVLKNLQHDLGSYKKDLQLVAVNANPVATSVADVYAWSKSHAMLNRWQYVTGSAAALKKVWASYYVATQVLKGDLVQHIPAVVVISPTGQERWLYINAAVGNQPVLSAEVHNLLVHVAPLLPGHPPLTRFPAARELTYLAGSLGPTQHRHRFSAQTIFPGGHLASLKVGQGGAPVLLDFFASWCPDCQEEIPVLKSYQGYAKAHHLPTVVGVDLRLSETSTAHVIHYVAQSHIPYPVALDATGNISDAYGVVGLPTEVLVSATGRILWYHQGLITRTALIKALRSKLPSS